MLSGRPVAEVKQRVDIPGLVHSGDHGLEVDGEAIRFMHPEAARCRAALEQLNQRLSGLPLLVPGVEVEPRPLATTIHFPPGEHGVHGRLGATVRSLILAEQLDLRVVEGDDERRGLPPAGLERRGRDGVGPSADQDQGCAGFRHRRQLLRRERVPGDRRGITVQFGTGDSTQARYWLDGPEEVASLLSWLFELWIRRLDRVDPAWPRAAGRPVLALKEASPILNVRLRRSDWPQAAGVWLIEGNPAGASEQRGQQADDVLGQFTRPSRPGKVAKTVGLKATRPG